VCDKYEVKVTARNAKAGGCSCVAVLVKYDHSLQISIPADKEGLSVLHNILSLMPINVHPIFLPSVSPVHFAEPAPGGSYSDCGLLCAEVLLDLRSCNIVNNVLGTYIATLCNPLEMELARLGEVLIF
jgi:hypothetical protein